MSVSRCTFASESTCRLTAGAPSALQMSRYTAAVIGWLINEHDKRPRGPGGRSPG